MPAIDLHARVLGPPGQPCAACGEPLAADQRYCLSCGERRGPPRLDPLVHARAAGGMASGAAAPAPAPARRRPATAWPLPSRRVASVATLLTLGFGVAAGAAAGPHAGTTLASATRRPMIVVGPPPAARAPAAQPAPEPAQPESSDTAAAPDTSAADSSTSDGSTADTSTSDSSSSESSTPDSSTPDSATTDSSTPDESDTPAADDASTTPAATTSKHVWIVALTGHTMDEALADPSPMPYLSGTLRPKALLLSGYKPALPGGLANLIALVSGQRPTAQQRGNCPAYDDVDPKAKTGCVFAKDVETLPGQLTAAGKTWRAYVENSDGATRRPVVCSSR
jgi:hypothetical protein